LFLFGFTNLVKEKVMSTTPKTPVSPKVWASLITGAAVAALTGLLNWITPATFQDLGMWAPLVYSTVTFLAGALAGYLKKDPLRVAPAAK
jgi:hypothetical protein